MMPINTEVAHTIQAKRLARIVEKFIDENNRVVYRDVDSSKNLQELNNAIKYLLSSGTLDNHTTQRFQKLTDELKKVASKPTSESTNSDKHHLSFAKEVYVEKIERIKESKVSKTHSIPSMSDTASAEKIQSLLQDQKVLLLKVAWNFRLTHHFHHCRLRICIPRN